MIYSNTETLPARHAAHASAAPVSGAHVSGVTGTPENKSLPSASTQLLAQNS